jgi:hypothetical protein
MAFPEAKPTWDPKEAEGQDNLHRYREALMAGLREGERKAINMNKVTEILQSLMKAQHSSMRDYVKHTIYMRPSILRLLKISEWSMSPLWGQPRETLEESYKN